MTKIKTHRMTDLDAPDSEKCEVCGRKHISYWTQASGKNFRPETRAIFHCQSHRAAARQIVKDELAQGEFYYMVG